MGSCCNANLLGGGNMVVGMSYGLTPEQIARRRNYIGGSDAPTIMSGLDEKIYDLWQEKRGERAPADLSDVLPVMMGHATEPFNGFWFQKQTGLKISREGEQVTHPDYDFIGCTLDGLIASENAIFQAKHCSGREPFDVIVERYMPQLQHEMAVMGCEKAYLSVFLGSSDWRCQPVAFDPFYSGALIEAECAFWEHVQNGTPPCAAPNVAPPLPEKLRELDMGKNNAWCANSNTWRETREAAKQHESASKELKAAVERDVGRAFGAGIQITRAKNGNLTIRELTQ